MNYCEQLNLPLAVPINPDRVAVIPDHARFGTLHNPILKAQAWSYCELFIQRDAELVTTDNYLRGAGDLWQFYFCHC